MKRRSHNKPPPDDAEYIVGSGVEFKPEHDLVNAGKPLPPPVELVPAGPPPGIYEFKPEHDLVQHLPVEPVELIPGEARGSTSESRPAEDKIPAAPRQGFESGLGGEEKEWHEQIRAWVLRQPGCQAYGAIIIDLWISRNWGSPEEFFAAVASAAALNQQQALHEAKKVMGKYLREFLRLSPVIPVIPRSVLEQYWVSAERVGWEPNLLLE